MFQEEMSRDARKAGEFKQLNLYANGGIDGTRTCDLWRDRPAS